MRKILKFPLHGDWNCLELNLPAQDDILCFAFQHGLPTVWAACTINSDKHPVAHLFKIVPTGEEEPDPKKWQYMITLPDGAYIWHIYQGFGKNG